MNLSTWREELENRFYPTEPRTGNQESIESFILSFGEAVIGEVEKKLDFEVIARDEESKMAGELWQAMKPEVKSRLTSLRTLLQGKGEYRVIAPQAQTAEGLEITASHFSPAAREGSQFKDIARIEKDIADHPDKYPAITQVTTHPPAAREKEKWFDVKGCPHGNKGLEASTCPRCTLERPYAAREKEGNDNIT